MYRKAKEITSKKYTELTEITNANISKFRILRAHYTALQHIINMPD